MNEAKVVIIKDDCQKSSFIDILSGSSDSETHSKFKYKQIEDAKTQKKLNLFECVEVINSFIKSIYLLRFARSHE